MTIPRTGKEPLAHAAYTTRDWSLTMTAASLVEEPEPPDSVRVRWLFHYRNSDSQPHYVAITVKYQNAQKKDIAFFTNKGTLEPTLKDQEARLELQAKSRLADWREAVYAKITIDFLSE